jgi:hypothetical protein
MLDIPGITLEKLQVLTERSNILITIDAPLFGTVLVFNGQLLYRGGTYVEPEKIGIALGLPTCEHILAEASRFWILDENGVRRLKCREEIAEMLEQIPPRTARVAAAKPASVQSAANG